MSAFSQLVQKNLDAARRGMGGRGTDERVVKASRPTPPQLDSPQGLGNTPPAQQAHDMYEGIDLTSPVMLNQMYQRYGPAFMHRAVKKHSSKDLHAAAKHPDLHPRVAVLLHAAAAVRKAFEGGNPLPAGPATYPNTSPSTPIPARPNHGPTGNPTTPYPATVGARSHSAPTAAPNPGAVTHEPQTAAQASHASGDGSTVGRQWVYEPSKGVPFVNESDPTAGGVGDNDQGYNDTTRGRYLGQPQAGDLIHFKGPGASTYQAKLVEVTTGHAIGEFAGQTVQFPLDGVRPHNVGGSDHGPANQPSGLTDSRGGSGVGLGAKNDASEFKPTDGSSNLTKGQRDAIYNGGQDMAARNAQLPVKSPDDGAQLTPYNAQHPYSPEEGQRNGAAPGNPVQGNLTGRERTLIERVMNHKAPAVSESAALKALKRGDEITPQHGAVYKAAVRRHIMAVPANRGAFAPILEKLAQF